MRGRDLFDFPGDPGVIVLDQPEGGHVVLTVGIEAGADENHLRPEAVQCRQEFFRHRRPEAGAVGIGRQRRGDDVPAHRVGAAVRIEGVLEARTEQHARVVLEDFLGAVAVVHVEVDDGHALEAVVFQGMRHADGDIVENAKAHRAVAAGVVAGRPHIAEGVLRHALHDELGGEHHGAGRAQRRLQAVRVHRGVGVEHDQSFGGRRCRDGVEIGFAVHAQELLAAGTRRIVVLKERKDAGGDEPILDGLDARRAFGMSAPHVVPEAGGMADVGGLHAYGGRVAKGNGFRLGYPEMQRRLPDRSSD